MKISINQAKKYFVIPYDRIALIRASNITLTVVVALAIANIILPNHLILNIWSAITGLLAPFAVQGETKLKQSLFLIQQFFWMIALLTITALLIYYLKSFGLLFFIPLLFVSYILPRFKTGTTKSSIFLIVYAMLAWQILRYNLHNQFELGSTIGLQILGVFIGKICCIVMTWVLPKNPIAVEPCNKERDLLIRGFRITIALTIALIIPYIHPINSVSWVGFAILITSQYALGASIRKSWYRILGTLFGVLVGIILAKYLFMRVPHSIYIAIPFLFLACYAFISNYTVGIFFITLLFAAALPYLPYPNINPESFLWSRMLDTLLGVGIGLGCELLLFPQSIFMIVRPQIKTIYSNIIDALNNLTIDTSSAHEAYQLLQTNVEEFKKLIGDATFEPQALLARRFPYLKRATLVFLHLSKNLMQLHQQMTSTKNESTHLTPIVQNLITIFNNLHAINQKYADDQTIKPSEQTMRRIRQEKQVLLDMKNPIDQSMGLVVQYTQSLVKLYHQMLKLPRWRFSFRRDKPT